MNGLLAYLLHNFTLSFLILGLLVSCVRIFRTPGTINRPLVIEALIRWFIFFSIGVSYLYNGIAHTVFAEYSAKFIGWANSPFQLEVGFASFGFAVIGFIAFRGSWQTRLCAILGPSFFLWGAAGGHINQMLTANDFAPGNAGVVFYTDIFVPIIGWILLYMSRPSVSQANQ
jgi:hypothetical protein